MAIKQENRWADRKALAFALKSALVVVPMTAAFVASVVTQRLVLEQFESLGTVGALAISFPVACATLVLGSRLARRAFPLAMLLRMTLSFPDEMPSRLSIALRAASPKRLARIASSEGYDAHSAEHVLALCAALNAHDRRTRGHSERVRALSLLVADGMGVTGADRDRLEWSALLHDIGKMSVSPEILNKPGRPDADEWAILQGHPASGVGYSHRLNEWLGEWRHAIDQHHERWDGSGYPLGLTGNEIALSGRIVALTDAFETMTATRSYKKPMSAEAARIELARCAGAHFDPAVVRTFMELSLPQIHRALGPASWFASLPFGGAATAGARIGQAVAGGAAAPVLAAAVAAGAITINPTTPDGGMDESAHVVSIPDADGATHADSPIEASIGAAAAAPQPEATEPENRQPAPSTEPTAPADPSADGSGATASVEVPVEAVETESIVAGPTTAESPRSEAPGADQDDASLLDPVTDTTSVIGDLVDESLSTVDDTIDLASGTLDDVVDGVTDVVEPVVGDVLDDVVSDTIVTDTVDTVVEPVEDLVEMVEATPTPVDESTAAEVVDDFRSQLERILG